MERNTRVCPTLLLLGIVLLLNTPHDVSGTSFLSRPIAIVRHNSVAETRIINESSSSQCILFVRGGSAVEEADEDEEDDEHDVVDEEESDDEVEETVALKTSTVKSAQKSVKSQVAQAMKDSEPIKISRRKRKSILAVLKIPYILRACLNPFTFMAMTKAYFSSLFNINYLEEESSQNLRSALAEKAKKGGGPTGGRTKPKRALKPGQAKTLSDLPQLSA